MQFRYIGILSALTATLALPSDLFHHVLHQRLDVENSPWTKHRALEAEVSLPMRIGLSQSNLDKGHDWLMEISDPESPMYGMHYTAEEVHDLFAPSDSSVATVRAWLEAAGINSDQISQSVNKQWIQFDVTASSAEALFRTKYHYYMHSHSDELSIGCDEYHVPEHVQSHIDYITPGVKMLATRTLSPTRAEKRTLQIAESSVEGRRAVRRSSLNVEGKRSANDLSNCSRSVTPQCIRALYNITQAESAQPGNELGIFETGTYSGDLYSQDLNSFFHTFDPRIPKGTFPIFEGVDGAENHNDFSHAGFEATLDFEVAYPIIYPQKPVQFLTDDSYYESQDYPPPKRGVYNTFLDAIDGSYCNYSAYGITGDSPEDPSYPDPHKGGYKGQLQCGKYKPTNVISSSYFSPEIGYGLPTNYYQRQCNEFMKLGLQGVSVVIASGDYGVGTTFPGLKILPNCLGPNRTVFSAQFPNTCPYVTSVGATRVRQGASVEGPDPEIASTLFASGGGFSNIFPRPSYQQDAVEAYFNSSAAPTYPYYTGHMYGDGVYNRTGRGFPDISAVGENIAIFYQNMSQLGDGTSAAAPLFASILTRINDERLKVGKPPVGFVNPFLYRNAHAFHDITVGDNPNCNTTGFNAGIGWDPVTGLGTPNYPVLLEAFMNA